MIAAHTRPATPNMVPRANPNKNVIMICPPYTVLEVVAMLQCPSNQFYFYNLCILQKPTLFLDVQYAIQQNVPSVTK